MGRRAKAAAQLEPSSGRRSGPPKPVDVHVGARVRLRRTLLGLSQEKLGAQLGLTFQLKAHCRRRFAPCDRAAEDDASAPQAPPQRTSILNNALCRIEGGLDHGPVSQNAIDYDVPSFRNRRTQGILRMPFDPPAGPHPAHKPRLRGTDPRPQRAAPPQARSSGPSRTGGSPQHQQTHWLARAAEADRTGDAVQAELCRQYAEHWYRVAQGQP
jgi:hypothetical protein